MRGALNDAAPLYRDAPEAREAKAACEPVFKLFIREVLPETSKAARALAGDLITSTLSSVGRDFSATPRTSPEIEVYADAVADMFCAYLGSLQRGGPSPTAPRPPAEAL